LALTIEGYIEFLIAAILGMTVNRSYSEMATLGEKLSFISSIVCFIICFLVVPLFFKKLMTTPLEVVRSEKFEHKYGVMYEDIKVSDRFTLSFNLVFVFRRLIFVVIVFTLANYPA